MFAYIFIDSLMQSMIYFSYLSACIMAHLGCMRRFWQVDISVQFQL